MSILRWLGLARETDQTRWAREAKILSRVHRDLLDEHELKFVDLMLRRASDRLLILDEHGKRIDEISARVQKDTAW